MACSDDAFSLYGGILRPGPPSVLPPFEWQLLTDSRTPTRTFHFQIAAPDGPDRFIEIDFLMCPFDPHGPPPGPPTPTTHPGSPPSDTLPATSAPSMPT